MATERTGNPGVTARVRAGKTTWYKSCSKRYKETRVWSCMSNHYAVYLGD